MQQINIRTHKTHRKLPVCGSKNSASGLMRKVRWKARCMCMCMCMSIWCQEKRKVRPVTPQVIPFIWSVKNCIRLESIHSFHLLTLMPAPLPIALYCSSQRCPWTMFTAKTWNTHFHSLIKSLLPSSGIGLALRTSLALGFSACKMNDITLKCCTVIVLQSVLMFCIFMSQ